LVNVQIEPAKEQDADAILALRHELEDWLESKGVEQWGRGEVLLSDVLRQVAAGEWHVVRAAPDVLVAALRLLWSDEQVWQEQNTYAAYVHGLMVARTGDVQGLGGRLLAWAEQQARAGAAPALRLDCVESNTALRTHYRGLGFHEVGRRDFDGPWFSAVLLERSLQA
jgi:GNAT superfamily N-acetyltransferase